MSDTHAYTAGRGHLLEPVFDFFRRARVDRLVHAGDAGSEQVLARLEAIAPTNAVRGNGDPLDLVTTLPDRVWIAVGAKTVLVMHGHHGKTALSDARGAASPEIDLIIFGHSHQPLIERHNHTILFNPGSPIERRWNPHFGIGLIDVSDSGIEPELVLFDDPRHLANVEP